MPLTIRAGTPEQEPLVRGMTLMADTWKDKIDKMMFEGGQNSGIVSRQDCTEFEDALRRLNALENKLTEQVCSMFYQD